MSDQRREQKPERKKRGRPLNTWIIVGVSLIAACLMFSVLLIVILMVGRVGVGMAFAWAGGAALITLAVVAITGFLFYRIPTFGSLRHDARGDD